MMNGGRKGMRYIVASLGCISHDRLLLMNGMNGFLFRLSCLPSPLQNTDAFSPRPSSRVMYHVRG
jgi:hypothetical protein